MKKIENMNNKGFSLVELIVSVLITGMLMLAVSVFLSSSRQMFQTVESSATLQEEAVTLERVISEYLMEAKHCGFEEGLDIKSSGNDNVLWVMARNNEDESISGSATDIVYFFVYDKEDHKIRYCKGGETLVEETSTGSEVYRISSAGKSYIAGDSGCYGKLKPYSLISENIDGFTCEFIPRADGTELACLKCTYSYMGKSYTSTITATTRNLTHTPITTTSSSGTPSGSGDTSGSGSSTPSGSGDTSGSGG